mmetsp:Transcript_22710/g.42227  ORF Transcript_22710/g.42227 Transcript_22710/m.42227 type:complete len:86 (-) Transcript_22710:1130-1387(-)
MSYCDDCLGSPGVERAKVNCDDFLGNSPGGDRVKVKAAKNGKQLEDEDKRPDVWVCRAQDPEPAGKRRSWKPKPGYEFHGWGNHN